MGWKAKENQGGIKTETSDSCAYKLAVETVGLKPKGGAGAVEALTNAATSPTESCVYKPAVETTDVKLGEDKRAVEAMVKLHQQTLRQL